MPLSVLPRCATRYRSVVSEETGQVSLAINGQIVRDIKEESLISKLFEELRPQFKAKNTEWKLSGSGKKVTTVDRWLNHPTAAKLMALAFGILMWAVVHFDPNDTSPNDVSSLMGPRKIDDVNVQPYGLDERNYVLLSLEPQTVQLNG